MGKKGSKSFCIRLSSLSTYVKFHIGFFHGLNIIPSGIFKRVNFLSGSTIDIILLKEEGLEIYLKLSNINYDVLLKNN